MGLSTDSRKLLEDLRARALVILERAEAAGSHDTALAAITEIRTISNQLDSQTAYGQPQALRVVLLDPKTGERTGEVWPFVLPDLPPPASPK